MSQLHGEADYFVRVVVIAALQSLPSACSSSRMGKSRYTLSKGKFEIRVEQKSADRTRANERVSALQSGLLGLACTFLARRGFSQNCGCCMYACT